MKTQRFSTCEVCDEMGSGLSEEIVKGQSTEQLKCQRKRHLYFIFRELLEYQTKKDRAKLHSRDYCSIIVDGADQSAFGLPHFTTTPKSQRGHAMKVKLIGLLEHRIENRLTLLTMTEEHATGANHVIEVVHRFLNTKRDEGPLPTKFHVQLDNCSRENKNKYALSYFEMLVMLGVFESVEVSFLPVGHTHEDVDQCFSQTSTHLRVHNAVTLNELHRELRKTNKGSVVQVNHMQRIANWSGLCDQENCLRRIDRVTQWRYFLFCRDSSCKHDVKNDPLLTKCFVKSNCVDPWQPLFKTDMGANPRGILRHCPNLALTPILSIECPDGLDNINKRLVSEEGRINSTEKMIQLHKLRDFVFAARNDEFHWDLSRTVETEFCGLYKIVRTQGHTEAAEGDVGITNDDILPQSTPVNDDFQPSGTTAHVEEVQSVASSRNSTVHTELDEPISKVSYSIGSFVIVQHDGASNSTGRKIWVAKVVEVIQNDRYSYAKRLRVHWFDRTKKTNDGRDILQATFQPCYQESNKKIRKLNKVSDISRQRVEQSWCDVIDTDTVLVSFPKLTARNSLPLSVQSQLSKQ